MSYLVRNAKRRAAADAIAARGQYLPSVAYEHGPCFWNGRCPPASKPFHTADVLQAFCEVNGIEYYHASNYGEPGYPASPRGILLTNWNRIPKTLSGRLIVQGYAVEYSDEWMVDTDHGDMAYRTSPDSYGWESSVRAVDDFYLTPDSDPQEWIDDSLNESGSPLPSWFDKSELDKRGYHTTGDERETGVHPHQTDDPDVVMRKLTDEGFDVILQVSDSRQFSTSWRVWARREAKLEMAADDTAGINIPRNFARDVDHDMVTGVDGQQWDILADGPDNPLYWDVWQEVLEAAVITSGISWTLHHDGDLWLIEQGAEYCEQEDTWYVYPQGDKS